MRWGGAPHRWVWAPHFGGVPQLFAGKSSACDGPFYAHTGGTRGHAC